MASLLSLTFRLFLFFCFSNIASAVNGSQRAARFEFLEATIDQIVTAFDRQELTSRELVEYYLGAIRELNPRLRAVIEVNPDALALADRADEERRLWPERARSPLHGVPVLLKDCLDTKDKLNTTAGSLALLGSVVRRDAGVVARLRRCGAIILGKAALTEWNHFRAFATPNGWSARGGQAINPYAATADPCGSSTGSATAVAANLAPVSLGTETDGSIICPASANSVVGMKPTVGLTSRAGMIPVSPRQDTIGPLSRTVADSVYLLDEIVGYDPRDAMATREAARFIPVGGYKQFLKKDGLRGKRLGIVRQPFFNFPSEPSLAKIFQGHIDTMRRNGAVIIDNLEISNISTALNYNISGELLALAYEFRQSINSYLADLENSPIRTLDDAIAFNLQHPNLEKNEEYGQGIFLLAENTSDSGAQAKMAVKAMSDLSENGYERSMKNNHLDAVVTPGVSFSAASVLAIGGYPAISVPAGYYGKDGVPVGICFSGPKFSEAALIEIAYSFEQATKNPYVETADPCGSSTGSATSVAANLVAVSLGTETDGSIICPANANSVVGIKPTVGLTSRAGMIPVFPRQDTIGPFSRTVADSVYVLDEIVGYDPRDLATREAARFIPAGGYRQFLKEDGLRGKRLGIVRDPFFNFSSQPSLARVFEDHIDTLRNHGAVIVDNLEISNLSTVLNYSLSGELLAAAYDFRLSLNSYLADLESSPIRSLGDAIAFNLQNPVLEKLEEYGQDIFLYAESTRNLGEEAKMAVKTLDELSRNGYEKMMNDNDLDAMVAPGVYLTASSVFAIGGYPAISVPAGYSAVDGVPVGICFGGLRFSEPALIEIAYSFEQATKIRKSPKLRV